jgi:hypothetical protein
MDGIGRVLILLVILLVIIGLVFTFWGRIPFLGNLSGDISFGSGKYRVYIPIVTSIVLSLILTIVLNIFIRLFNK